MKLYIYCSLFFVVSAASGNDVLKSERVGISGDELKYYFEDRLPPKAKAMALTSKKTYVESLENVYLIKHFAELARENGKIGVAENWVADLERDRVLMKFYIGNHIKKKFSQIDWAAMGREEYIANKGSYKTAERVSASHILIKSDGLGYERALTRAQEVYQKLKEGQDFNSLVGEYSDDKGSKTSNGSLGFFTRTAMVKPFSDAAFLMVKKGDVSEPVKSSFGYHIIRFDGRKPAGLKSFDEISSEIIAKRKKQLKAKLHKDLVFSARNSGDYTIDQIELEKLRAELEAQYPLPKL